LDSKEVMEVFDKEIFSALVDYVIVGGYDEKVSLIRCLETA